MYRLLSISLLAIAVLVGYSLRGEPKVSAQTLTLPYSVGDSVRLDYADGGSRGCLIERFYSSFVSCTVSSPAFVAPDAPPKIVYNLSTVISIQLVKRGN